MNKFQLSCGRDPQHYRKKSHKTKIKILLCILPVMFLSSLAITGSACYLKAETPTLSNPFYKGIVNIGVVEQAGGDVTDGRSNIPLVNNSADKNVWIKNLTTPGNNAPAYIRVKLVAIWRNADGTGSGIPVDISYILAQDDRNTAGKWVTTGAGQDTVYYFTKPVEAGGLTDQLLDSVTVNGTVPPDKKLEIQVIADAVQSEGGAVENTWGVNPETLQS